MPLTRRHVATAAALAMAAVGGALTVGGLRWRTAAPQLTYTLLDGTTLRTADLHGQVVLVNFWATSCTACIAEMPRMIATDARFRASGLRTLAIAMRYDPPALVAEFAESRQLPFGVVIDNTGAIAHGFGDVQLTPTSLLLDRRGRIAERVIGPPDFEALHQRIEQLLAES